MKKIEITNKFINYSILIALLITVIFSLVIKYSYSNLEKYEIQEGTNVIKIKENKEYSVKIEEVSNKEWKLYIRGYSYKLGENILNFNDSVVLKEKNGSKYYRARTTIKIENSLKNEINDYSRSGFETKINTKSLVKGEYEIYILDRNNKENTLIQTDEIIEI